SILREIPGDYRLAQLVTGVVFAEQYPQAGVKSAKRHAPAKLGHARGTGHAARLVENPLVFPGNQLPKSVARKEVERVLDGWLVIAQSHDIEVAFENLDQIVGKRDHVLGNRSPIE